MESMKKMNRIKIFSTENTEKNNLDNPENLEKIMVQTNKSVIN